MSETTVSLITAGAAVAASGVTGAITWLAGRSQAKLQTVERRSERAEQLKREACASCLQELTNAHLPLMHWAVAWMSGGDQSAREPRLDLDRALRSLRLHEKQLFLLMDQTVRSSWNEAYESFIKLWEKSEKIAKSGDAHTEEEFYARIEDESKEFQDCEVTFINHARDALSEARH